MHPKMFTESDELDVLRSRTVTSDRRGGRRYRPWVFTEHGALMSSMILNSDHAIAVSVYVIRAFVKMREALTANVAILNRQIGFHSL